MNEKKRAHGSVNEAFVVWVSFFGILEATCRLPGLIAIISHSVLIKEAHIFARILEGILALFPSRYMSNKILYIPHCEVEYTFARRKIPFATSAANNFGVGA